MKTGDLVVCLLTPNPAHHRFEGAIRRIGPVENIVNGTHWHLDPPTMLGGRSLLWNARVLRKIDNPGDDAVDETLLWTTPGDRASRNIERCEKLVAEIEGQS